MDNQPLQKILGPKSGIPPLATRRLQRWTIILSQYDYELNVKPNLRCADMFSRLLIKKDTNDGVLKIEMGEPLTSLDVKNETSNEPTLSKVVDLTERG